MLIDCVTNSIDLRCPLMRKFLLKSVVFSHTYFIIVKNNSTEEGLIFPFIYAVCHKHFDVADELLKVSTMDKPHMGEY